MSGICGWFATDAWASDVAKGLEMMAATFPTPPDGTRPPTRIAGSASSHALAACGAGTDCVGEGALLAAVDGELWFKDSDLTALASRRGQAAACLEAFRRSGESLVDLLGGAFAIAIMDTQARTCLLATDRVGVRPLAFGYGNQGALVFASTATAVQSHPDISRGISEQALFEYCYFHMIPSPETVYAGVRKMQPAQLLSWRPGRHPCPRTYWIPQFQDRSQRSESELAQQFLGSLKTAVARTAPSARTATFLSGGIDSSTVTGLLSQIAGKGRPAYTVGFEESGYDETQFAQIAAQHFGAELRVHYISSTEVAQCIPQLAALYDEPFGNSSAVPTLICSQWAKREGIDHLLAGDGGDELFAGNVRYAKQKVFEHYWRLPAGVRSSLEALLGLEDRGPAPVAKLRSYMRQARMPMPDRMESYNFLLREGIENIFQPEFLRAIDPEHPLALLRERYSEARASSLLDRMLYLDWKFTLADNDLRKVGATCRYAGVAVSFPWLADELTDLATQVPPQWKMQGKTLRAFAKRALTGFLAEATLRKQKHGFGLPFGEWLKKYPDLQGQIYALIADLGKRSVLRRDFLDRLIEEHRVGHAAYYGSMVWVFAMLEAWLQAHRVDI
jgi:asparagine synthase (glutamine-hydrolysing)